MSLGAIVALMMRLATLRAPTDHMVAMAEAVSSTCEGDPECVRVLVAVAWLETRFYNRESAQTHSPWGLTAGRWRPGDSLEAAAHEAFVSVVSGRRHCGNWRRGFNRYNTGECHRGYGRCITNLIWKLAHGAPVRGFSCPHRRRRGQHHARHH